MKTLINLSLLVFVFACAQAPLKKSTPKVKPNPYPRIESGLPRACWVTQEMDHYETRFIFDCTQGYSPSTRLFAGYGFKSKSRHPFTSEVKSPYPRGNVARSIDMISRHEALNETYLHIVDSAGGPDSHDPKSVIYLFPRVMIPQVTESSNQVELTLPTGEKAYFDAGTGALTSGVLEEGPLDRNPNHRNRRPPNVRYTGNFVSLRLTHSYDDPTTSAGTAFVMQKNNICKLPRNTLFSKQGKLLTRSDEEFLEVINRECPVRFEY